MAKMITTKRRRSSGGKVRKAAKRATRRVIVQTKKVYKRAKGINVTTKDVVISVAAGGAGAIGSAFVLSLNNGEGLTVECLWRERTERFHVGRIAVATHYDSFGTAHFHLQRQFSIWTQVSVFVHHRDADVCKVVVRSRNEVAIGFHHQLLRCSTCLENLGRVRLVHSSR